MNAGSVGTTSSGLFFGFHIHGRRKLASLSCPSPVKPLRVPHSLHISSSPIRQPRGRPLPKDQRSHHKHKYTDQNVEFAIDLDHISSSASASIKRFFRRSEAKINRFFSSGADAYSDLKSSFRTERGSRIVFSCRRSSLQFFGNLFFWSFVVVFTFMLASRLWSRRRWVFSGWAETRRDRSLGGREVVVGRRNTVSKPERRGFTGLMTPLSTIDAQEVKSSGSLMRKQNNKQEQLPKWWSYSISSPIITGNDEARREAYHLVKVIMDNRISGKDYKDEDFIQLRKICRSSGAKVSFETANARDSFFRAAVSFVLNVCSRARQPGIAVQIDGEDVNQFICGLACNIGLDNTRAAKIVCAAVAASTRSRFLQSWAFEVQGKRMEALEELFSLSQIYHCFPLEENSAELEMVACALKNSLRIDQRTHLLTLFDQVCSSDGRRIAAEALGLARSASV